MRSTVLVSGLVCAGMAAAQQPVPQQQLPTAEQYRQAVQILKDGGTSPVPSPAKATRKLAPKRSKAPDLRGTIDSHSIEAYREIALPASAKAGLALSKEWLTDSPPPIASPDSRMLFIYGKGVPTIVCAILQVCELDLEPGERPVKDSLEWGDNRFLVAVHSAGGGAEQFPYLALRPTMPGLDTTLTIGTSKRAYYVRLISTSDAHMTRAAFTYPEEAEERRKREERARQMHEEWQKKETARLAQLNTLKPCSNWSYSVKLHGKDAKFLRPEKICDDGVHTRISLSEVARHRGLPVVQISDARGPIPANTHWENNELVIDAVFENACLLEGVGKKQQRACLTNKGLQGPGGHE